MTLTSTLYQGLQSCLEPTLLEPRILMNKLTPPKSDFSQPTTLPQKSKIGQQEGEIEEENEENDNVGGWSFIHALENPCQYSRKGDAEDRVYVHPLVKPCSLNTKSLEMCTESLGSETGSDICESIEEFSNYHGVQRSKCREFAQKFNRTASFPPPLTSMSGNEGVQVRPHREDGRLILKAMTITSCNSNFQAERANGRLRLSLLIPDECSHGEEDEISQENEHGNDEDIGGRKLGSDIVVGEYSRPRRCKTSGIRNKGIPSWEPFWVAIS
ncbi:protein FANTASTIC FOUR 3-like [Lycium barbarum]|uniref:protein FANTASTIC FOUR 3-like n=1 Tax=Lycium barbarum TaxID=112863 RepID=UPI00293F23AC|nr:protein FANTASTIC FOUR 3-like [Lycium barbarum]